MLEVNEQMSNSNDISMDFIAFDSHNAFRGPETILIFSCVLQTNTNLDLSCSLIDRLLYIINISFINTLNSQDIITLKC